VQSKTSVQRCVRALRLTSILAGLLTAASAGAPADDEAIVHVGYVMGSSSSLVVRVADRFGYFRAQHLKIDLLPFDSGAHEVGPLDGRDIDVAAGEPSAKLFAAVAGGSAVRIVAPAVSDPPGRGAQPLVVRSDIVRDGRFRDVPDLRGMTIAVGAPGTSSWSMLNELLRHAGLRLSDVKPLALPFRDHRLALESSLADASLLPEPYASQAVKDGVAVRVLGNDAFYPNQDASVAMFSGEFLGKRRAEAQRFMRAYVEAARTYDAAVVDGKLAGPNADAIVKLIAQTMPSVEPAAIRSATPFGVDPDAGLNTAALEKDLEFYRSQGLVGAHVRAADAVDPSVAAAAVAQLGPVHPAAAAASTPKPSGQASGGGTDGGGGGGTNMIILGLVGAAGLLIVSKVVVEVMRP
jgi:NitT/TauT family transport system substrate-binding protein